MCSPLVEIRECKSDTKRISSDRMHPTKAYIADEYYNETKLRPVKLSSDSASMAVKDIENWAMDNRMSLNMSKTWEMLVCGKTMHLTFTIIDNWY